MSGGGAETVVRLGVGDVVEIRAGAGLRYVQVTHRHPSYPEVFRILAGRFATRPALAELARVPTEFTALCPLSAILTARTLEADPIGPAPVPPEAQSFPTFRTPIRDRQGGVVYWWFWNGEALHFDASPPPEAEGWPLREVTGAAELLRRLGGIRGR